MDALVGLFFLFAGWLTYLTYKEREHARENKELKKNSTFYLKELRRLSNEKDKEGKADQETETPG